MLIFFIAADATTLCFSPLAALLLLLLMLPPYADATPPLSSAVTMMPLLRY